MRKVTERSTPLPHQKKNFRGILTCISCLKPTDTCRLVTITLELLETEITDAQRRKEPIFCLSCQCLEVCLWVGWRLVVDGGGVGRGLQCILYPFAWSEHRCERQQMSLEEEEASGRGIREC